MLKQEECHEFESALGFGVETFLKKDMRKLLWYLDMVVHACNPALSKLKQDHKLEARLSYYRKKKEWRKDIILIFRIGSSHYFCPVT